MHDVEQRATGDQEGHHDDVCLHNDGWYGRRKFGEWITGEHWPAFPPMSLNFDRHDSRQGARLQSIELLHQQAQSKTSSRVRQHSFTQANVSFD
jgi:hypothetical protein